MQPEQRQCLECNAALAPRKRNGPAQKFCGPACRKLFNNRRMTRGAEFYDYFMSMRYLRDTHAGAMNVMTQMASKYRDKDKSERDGRPSWHIPDMSADPRAFDND